MATLISDEIEMRYSSARGAWLGLVTLANFERNQARTYLLNQSIVRCQDKSAAALL
jgi:hypothetical protein